jgi:hypothetical protein
VHGALYLETGDAMRLWLAVPLMLVSGCSPLIFPMPMRLGAQEQQRVDSAWNAMLTPVNRLDRQTLLDCVVMMQLYQSGVDRFTARSEKQTSAGKVEMTIEFDRQKPKADQFAIRVVGPWGGTHRYEKWSAKEMFETYFRDADGSSTTAMADEARNAEMSKRYERFRAATQPATQ